MTSRAAASKLGAVHHLSRAYTALAVEQVWLVQGLQLAPALFRVLDTVCVLEEF